MISLIEIGTAVLEERQFLSDIRKNVQRSKSFLLNTLMGFNNFRSYSALSDVNSLLTGKYINRAEFIHYTIHN